MSDVNALQDDIEELEAENAKLRAALEGVLAVADRKTKEFDAAREALGTKRETP